MIQEYNMDVEEQSIWLIATPRALVSKPPFLVSEAGKFYAKGGYYTERRDKADYLLIYTFAGQGLLHYKDKDWLLKKGTVAFIDCREYHRYQTAPGASESWQFYWLHINSPHCDFFERNLHSDGFCICFCGRDQTMEDHFEQILKMLENTHLNAYCAVSNATSNILSLVVATDSSGSIQETPYSDAINNAVDYIRQHYREPLNLNLLAAQAQLSKFYFLRLFKAYMQVTPYKYLVYYRINESKKLLDTTNHKVCHISEMVGFADECNYVRTFKEITGQTPLQYRRSQR